MVKYTCYWNINGKVGKQEYTLESTNYRVLANKICKVAFGDVVEIFEETTTPLNIANTPMSMAIIGTKKKYFKLKFTENKPVKNTKKEPVGITVQKLYAMLETEINKGNGQKLIVMSDDDEVNGLHTLFEGVISNPTEVKNWFNALDGDHDRHNPKDVVILM